MKHVVKMVQRPTSKTYAQKPAVLHKNKLKSAVRYNNELLYFKGISQKHIRNCSSQHGYCFECPYEDCRK